MNILYIVATPIGNLKDITFRAVEVLKHVDLILCEDTRVSQKLLSAYDIKTQVLSYHQHSKISKIDLILEKLNQGQDIALISDAGTPGISDPGNLLVQKVVENGFQSVAVPGPCSVTAAASVSGFPTDSFLFLGFAPKKKGKNKFFKKIQQSDITVIFLESVHRIEKTLNILTEVIPERKIVLCKEITKKFEQCFRGTALDVLEQIQSKKLKGEFVVVVNSK